MSTSGPAAPDGAGSGSNSESVRIGDADRNAAVEALGDHLTTGRLDLEEYGTRSALANAARTVGDLHALFADLPAPHPMLPGDLQAMADDRSRVQKLVGAAAAASGIIALILFFATGLWWWFLLVPLISSIAGSVWGDSGRRPGHRHHGRR